MQQGQISQRSANSFTVRVYMGTHPQTGKRIYRNQTVKGTKKDAERALIKMLRDRDTGSMTEQTSFTVNAWLDRWLDTSVRPRLRANTCKEYEDTLKRYVRPYIGHKRLDKLTPLDIQTAMAELQNKKLSNRTQRAAHTVLSTALKQAVKLNLLQSNPAQRVDKPKQQRKEMAALNQEEVGRFLAAAAEDRWGVVFAFAIGTGMRPSEILGLQWKDVDLQSGTVMVRRGLTLTKGVRHLNAPKTERSRRTIPLPGGIIAQLRQHRADQAAERLAAGSAYENEDFVFAGPKGKPLNDKSLIENHLKPILKRAGLPTQVRFYDLRHTCATLLLLANEHPKVVSERLGHSTITLTLDTYSHVLPSMQKGAADKLDNMMFG